MTPKYDYKALEREFINSPATYSIRQLGKDHDIPASKISSLHAQASKPDANGRTWYDKRDAVLGRSSEKSLEVYAQKATKREERRLQVVDHALEMIDAALVQTTERIKAGEQIVYPKEIAMLLDRLIKFKDGPTGNPDMGIDFGSTEITSSGGEGEPINVGVLVHLERATRGAAARSVGGGTGRSSLPDAEGAGEDQHA